MLHVRFTAILKYLRFDDKPKMHWGRSRLIHSNTCCFPDISNNVSVKYRWNFSLTVDEQLMLLKPRCSFQLHLCQRNLINTALSKSIFSRHQVKALFHSRLAKYWVDGNSFFNWYTMCAWKKFPLKLLRPIPLPSTEISLKNIKISWSKMQQGVCASLARHQLVAHVLLAYQKNLRKMQRVLNPPCLKH